MVAAFFSVFNTNRDIKNFVQISIILFLFNKILNITGNIDSRKKADHVFEMPGLGKLCDYYFKNHTC